MDGIWKNFWISAWVIRPTLSTKDKVKQAHLWYTIIFSFHCFQYFSIGLTVSIWSLIHFQLTPNPLNRKTIKGALKHRNCVLYWNSLVYCVVCIAQIDQKWCIWSNPHSPEPAPSLFSNDGLISTSSKDSKDHHRRERLPHVCTLESGEFDDEDVDVGADGVEYVDEEDAETPQPCSGLWVSLSWIFGAIGSRIPSLYTRYTFTSASHTTHSFDNNQPFVPLWRKCITM